MHIIIYTQIDFRINTGFEAIFCLFEYILYDFKDTTPKVWPWILAFFNVWKGIGYGSVMYLAAIMGIDTSLYEAAAIDGANVFQRFRRIIIPIASPQIFFVLIMNVTGALRIYESIFVLTGGGPGDSSRSLVMLVAEKGFTSFDYGAASALSVLLLMLIGIVTLIQFAGSRWWVHYE